MFTRCHYYKINILFRSTFKADDKNYCYETNKANVTVIGSTGSHDHGSSKVKLKTIVNYKWEMRNYPGRLIAVHPDGKHIAYAIRGGYLFYLFFFKVPTLINALCAQLTTKKPAAKEWFVLRIQQMVIVPSSKA